MKAKDIIRIWRSDVDDEVEPYLWGEPDALDYLNDAQNEAARRGRLLVDSGTAAITQITTAPGTASYALDPRVLFIRKARIAGCLPLKRMSAQDMEALDPYWEDAPANPNPSVFIPDTDSGKLRIWPPPSVVALVQLTVVRDPLAEMNDLDDAPELNPRYQRSLRFWMTYRACMKPDAETFDPKKALAALALFEQEFGAKSSALDENWIEREQMQGDGTF